MNSPAGGATPDAHSRIKTGRRGNAHRGQWRRSQQDVQHNSEPLPSVDADKLLPEPLSPNVSLNSHLATLPIAPNDGYDAKMASLELGIIASLADLGFVIPPGLTLACQGLALYKAKFDALTRLYMLLDGIHLELNGLMGYVNMQQACADPSIMAWKEKIVTSLMTEIMPRLGVLIQRVGKDIEVSMLQNDAAVKVFIGGRKAVSHDSL